MEDASNTAQCLGPCLNSTCGWAVVALTTMSTPTCASPTDGGRCWRGRALVVYPVADMCGRAAVRSGMDARPLRVLNWRRRGRRGHVCVSYSEAWGVGPL